MDEAISLETDGLNSMAVVAMADASLGLSIFLGFSTSGNLIVILECPMLELSHSEPISLGLANCLKLLESKGSWFRNGSMDRNYWAVAFGFLSSELMPGGLRLALSSF